MLIKSARIIGWGINYIYQKLSEGYIRAVLVEMGFPRVWGCLLSAVFHPDV